MEFILWTILVRVKKVVKSDRIKRLLSQPKPTGYEMHRAVNYMPRKLQIAIVIKIQAAARAVLLSIFKVNPQPRIDFRGKNSRFTTSDMLRLDMSDSTVVKWIMLVKI